MRCLYYSYCNEPKYLCCNFCSKKDCDERCKDDHTSCKFYEQGPVDVSKDKPNHIIGKRKNAEMLLQRQKEKEEEMKLMKAQEESSLTSTNEIKKKRGRPKKVKEV